MDIIDTRPITLRAEDLPDPQSLVIDLTSQMRELLDLSVQVRDIHHRSMFAADHRSPQRVHSRLVELHEATGAACDQFDMLTRSLRAAGRL